MADKTGEVKTEITESQLIHLNRCVNGILEAKENYNSNNEDYLKSIIESQKNRAREIKRMLKYVNSGKDIRK